MTEDNTSNKYVNMYWDLYHKNKDNFKHYEDIINDLKRKLSLYEKNNDLITQASYVNQYRLHRGYHYPRSKETAKSSVSGETTFLDVYGDAILNGDIEHYYCIAKKDSLVSSSEYESFLNELNLKYKEKTLDIIQENVVDLIVNAEELLFDPNKITAIIWNNLKKLNIKIAFSLDQYFFLF